MTEQYPSSRLSRRSWPAAVLVVVAWAVSLAVIHVLRTVVGSIGVLGQGTLAGEVGSILLTTVVPAGAAVAGCLVLPRERAGSLGLTLLCALPVPVVVLVTLALSLPAYIPDRSLVITRFLALEVTSALVAALLTWWVRRRRAGRGPLG